MQPLRGSFWALVLYDVAEQIQLDKLRGLIRAEPPRREPSFKHPAPEYVRFERPPVVEYPDPVSTETGELQIRVKYFDYGVISIELELRFTADWDELVALSSRWISAPEIETRTSELIRKARSGLPTGWEFSSARTVRSTPSAAPIRPPAISSQAIRVMGSPWPPEPQTM